MKFMHMSGSTDIPLAALLFFKDGTMALSAPDCPEQEKSSLLITSDFFSYALTRDDWMSAFIESIKKEHTLSLEQKPRLRVIQGGLSGSVDLNKR